MGVLTERGPFSEFESRPQVFIFGPYGHTNVLGRTNMFTFSSLTKIPYCLINPNQLSGNDLHHFIFTRQLFWLFCECMREAFGSFQLV